MSYKFSRDIGYQPWGVTNPWVFANFGQPQRARGYVSPMIFQTQAPHLRQPNLGGLGVLPMMAVRMAAAPATATAARTAARRMAASTAAPMFSAARTAASRHAATAMPLAVRSRMAATRMAASAGQDAQYLAAAARIRAARKDSARMRTLHERAARMGAGFGADPVPAPIEETVHVTAQSVLDEELARSRRMEIVSVASLVLGVASYMLFRRAMMNKNPNRRRRRHRRHS